MTAALEGFKTFVRDGIVLHTAETLTLNIPLAVGTLEETVSVSAAASAIESNESTIAQSANFGIVDTASQVNFPRTTQLGIRIQF